MTGITGHISMFDHYPELRHTLSSENFVDVPTPVEAMPGLSPQAWIKRDDLTHKTFGGNKIRKLAFILARVRKLGKTRIITFGAKGSNHGVATAMLCHRLGLDCTILLFPRPDSPTVRRNQERMKRYGATLVPTGSMARCATRFYMHPGRLSRNNYFLNAGGSDEYGTLGYVNAAFELREQIQKGQCPAPHAIICPVSSPSTLAGLTLGVALAGLKCRVRGIRMAPSRLGPFTACTPQSIKRLMNRTLELMESGTHIPWINLPEPLLSEQYYGPGYGISSDESANAISLFRSRAGIDLDPTYSGKAAAAFLDELRKTEKPVLFWNTYDTRRPYPDDVPEEAGDGTQ